MNELITRVHSLEKASKKINDLWLGKKEEELSILKAIPKRSVSDVAGTTATGIKKSFGKLFYDVLCPINGVSPKNKRFSDGTNKYDGRNTPRGPCIWKKVGKMSNWGARASWYSSDQLYDQLSTEHIDLVLNGLRNRKDQIEVSRELYGLRDLLKEQLKLIDKKDDSSNLSISLSKPYTVKQVIAREISTVNSLNNINRSTGSKYEVPIYELDIVISSCTIQESILNIPIKPSSSDTKILQDKFDIDVSGYPFDNKIDIPLLQNIDKTPTAKASWESSYYIFGLADLIQDKAIDTLFSKMFNAKKEAINILEKAQTKYAGRILASGIF